MKKLFLLFFCSSFLAATAQDIIYYEGMGRSEIDKNLVNGNFLENDTASDKRDLNGRFIFDLGVNIEPNKDFRAKALLRLNNTFGGFYSQGSSLEFRQILLQGVLADKFNYQIGDMDLQLTPYTLFNNDEIYNEFESDIFALKRDVVNYENFNIGNNWRLQGLQTNTTLKFEKAIEKLYINVFGTRVRGTDIATTPDRVFVGGNIDITQSKYFELGLNSANLFDVVGTSNDTASTYSNSVHTAKFKTGYELDAIDFNLFGELGISQTSIEKESQNLDTTQNGGFFDIGISAKFKDLNTKISVSYRSVNDEFNSPGAQSRRILAQNSPVLFVSGQNGTATRAQQLFDRINGQSLYSQSLSPTLMDYNPAYNNVTPYGIATPNRQGITIDLESGHRDSLYFVHLASDLLTETVGEGTSEKRSFNALKGGFVLNAEKLFNYEKLITLSTGAKFEKTTRNSGTTSEDLSSILLDAGLAIETFSKLDLLLGYKYFTAEGSVFYTNRIEDLNDITSFTTAIFDHTENITGLGLRYRFSDQSFFTINANIVSYNINETIVPNGDYKITQYYFNYTVRF